MSIIYAVPDIHGCRAELEVALAKVDLTDATTRVVFLGDYIDRGPDSRGVLDVVKQVQDSHPDQVIALRGNHEEWFLEWLDADDDDPTWLLADTGFTTIRSFLPADLLETVVVELVDALHDGSVDADLAGRVNAAVKREMRARHGRLIDWLRVRPLFYETDTHIYVHAGVDEEAGDDWRLATPDHVFMFKYPETHGPNVIGKVIVAGHVGVGAMHAAEGRMRCREPFVDAGHIYLDGMVEDTGVLNVMKYDSTAGTTEFLSVND